MLVKSQTEEVLFVLEDVIVRIQPLLPCQIVAMSKDVIGDGIFIAKYDTPERAKQVLIEMFHAYANQYDKTYGDGFNNSETFRYNCTFEMPLK